MLTSQEAKAVLEAVWNLVNANPDFGYGAKAFEKMVLKEFYKANAIRLAKFDQPIRIAAE